MIALTLRRRALAAGALGVVGLGLAIALGPPGRLVAAGLVLAVAGYGLMVSRSSAVRTPPLVSVVGRAALSNRCAFALVEADGQRFAIVFGEGAAQVIRMERSA